MLKNIALYLAVLCTAFVFNIFYYAWFSWYLLVLILCIPVVSLLLSLPFMIYTVKSGLVVFASENIGLGKTFTIGVACKKRNVFCPQLRIKLKIKNHALNKSYRRKLSYGGSLFKPVYFHLQKLSAHCTVLEARADWCKIYDMLGIFFIPVRIRKTVYCAVLPNPQKPKLLPETDKLTVLGYSPKRSASLDFYELREYQTGDSLKSIHWKLSSKYDKLIVKEPVEPILKQLILKPELCKNPDSNDDILARFTYAARYAIANWGSCAAMCPNGMKLISNDRDIVRYIKTLFTNNFENTRPLPSEGCEYYIISETGEEVRI